MVTISHPSLGERMPSVLFIWWAFVLALGAGFGLGTLLFAHLALGSPVGLWLPAAIQAHGHAQLFGWGAMFALGVGLYFLPRLRGCPPPNLLVVRAAGWLLGIGLTLRVIAQPLVAADPPERWESMLLLLLIMSGLLELLGAAMAVGALVAAASQGPPLRSRAALLAVLPFSLAFFSALLVGLLLNVALLMAAVVQGNPLLPPAGDAFLVHLGLVGMLVPISAAVSARTLPLYLQAPVPTPRALYAVFVLLLVGFLARSAGLLGLPDPAERLAGAGALLEGAALIGLAVALDVPFRRSRRTPAGQKGADWPEYRAADCLIVPAYVWLIVAGLLMLAEGLSVWGLLPRPPRDAERHALGSGFVTLLIFGMGVRLLPGFAGRRLYSVGLVWATVWLGNASALLRVAPLLLPTSPANLPLLAASGLLALIAVACLGWNLWRTLYRPVSGR